MGLQLQPGAGGRVVKGGWREGGEGAGRGGGEGEGEGEGG